MLFLGLVSMTLPMEAQKIITTNEDGDNITPARDCWKADFATCVSNKLAYDYIFPVIFGSCSGATVQVIPADAGTATVTDDGRTVTVVWNRSGVFTLHVAVSVAYPLAIVVETRNKTVSVNFANQDYSNFTLSDVSTCASPGTSFRLNSVTKGYVRAYYLSIYEVTKNGSWTGGVWWNSGWVCESYDGQVIDASTVNFPFVVGRKYRIKVAVHTNCSGWQETNGEIITIGDCRPTASALINGSGDNPATMCMEAPMILNNTSTAPASAPITEIELKVYGANANCNNVYNLLETSRALYVPILTTYDLNVVLQNYFKFQSSMGWHSIEMRAKNSWGWSDVYKKCVHITNTGRANATFKFKVGNALNNLGIYDIPATPESNINGSEIGIKTAGIIFTGTGNYDKYQVEIWETNPTTGAVIAKLHDSGETTVPVGFLPTDYGFNDVLCGVSPPLVYDYFYNLRTNMPVAAAKRFKVRVMTHNSCGWSDSTSYFRFRPDCPNCLLRQDSNTAESVNNQGLGAADSDSERAKKLDYELLVTPNPTSQVATFYLSNSSILDGEIVTLRMYDASGHLVKSVQKAWNTAESAFEVDCSSLVSGIYTYQFVSRQKVAFGKLMKE